MNLSDYPRAARDLTSYWGSWPVSLPLSVGWIGVVRDGAFMRETDLANISEIPAPRVISNPGDETVTYSRHVDFRMELRGDAGTTGGEATATVSFSREAGTLIALHRPRYHQIDDIPMLKKQILALVREELWQRDWIVVVETVEARGVTVLVSSERDASIELDVRADPGAIGPADLARAELGLRVRARKSIGMEAIAKRGTPLYRTLRVRESFWGKAHVGLSGDAPVPEDAFEDVALPVEDGQDV